MSRLFGTDGVRGVVNKELTAELASRLGSAGAWVLGKNRTSSGQPLFVIGRDTRISGEMLEDALCEGIQSAGGRVIRVGVIPTPGIAYLVRKYGADAGVVISASHNPYEYNGIKFFNGNGLKLDDAIEDEIEAIVTGDNPVKTEAADGNAEDQLTESVPPLSLYKEFVKSTFDGSLQGMKLVLDCANGASSVLAGDVFRELGAEVVVISDQPDGVNINDHCGSTHPEELQRRVVQEKADAGLAFDGDADRLIAVDEKGNIVDGDRTISIITRYLKDENRLKENTVTVTVMSNIGFHKYAKKHEIHVDVTDVGDRYVLEKMLQTGGIIGGEQSGHIILLEHSTTGDGMIAGLQLLKSVQKYQKPLSELAEEIIIYPQVLVNAKVSGDGKERYKEDPEIQEAIRIVEEKVNRVGAGRVLIRPSGTEPLVRVMIEGVDKSMIQELAEELAKLIEGRQW